MSLKAIPAFYGCYLLRSSSKSITYIGSTSNPSRRLAQHNGGPIKGGAKRTAREDYRPWEMTCIVEGFPSKIAALQFEWAWQNPHLTRKIEDRRRLTRPRTSKQGTSGKRIIKPRLSLYDQLKTLDLLLKVSSFSRMPLQVRFFSEDVFHIWLHEDDHSGCRVILDLMKPNDPVHGLPVKSSLETCEGDSKPIGTGGVDGIEVGYDSIDQHLKKSSRLLSSAQALYCSLCRALIHSHSELTLVCPKNNCHAVSHIACLAKNFLSEESTNESSVPRQGRCPCCDGQTSWIELVKELSLRSRGCKDTSAT